MQIYSKDRMRERGGDFLISGLRKNEIFKTG